MTYQAGPPVFDGPEDRNGLRNRDENRFWTLFLDGRYAPPPSDRFVIAGGANLDPIRGEGHRTAISALLADTRLQDPMPEGPHTVHWERVGRMRVDYVLPSADWKVLDAGVMHALSTEGVSRHGLVWADLSTAEGSPNN